MAATFVARKYIYGVDVGAGNSENMKAMEEREAKSGIALVDPVALEKLLQERLFH